MVGDHGKGGKGTERLDSGQSLAIHPKAFGNVVVFVRIIRL